MSNHSHDCEYCGRDLRVSEHSALCTRFLRQQSTIDSLNREIDHLLEENAEYQGENAALRRLRKELSAEIRGARDENEMLRCRGRHLIAEVRRDWNLGRVSVDSIQAARQLEMLLSAQSDDTSD